MMRSSSSTTNTSKNNSGTTTTTTTTISCKDCGNKAKRECEHMRCRSCCKTQGFVCPTHVKSTWVPVAKRRLKLHQQFKHFHLLPSSTTHHHRRHHHDNHRASILAPEGGNFPAEVNSLATFRCIKVTSEDNVVEQYAYQTSINIGGHIFKGILYHQEPTGGGTNGGDQSSSANDHHSSMAVATTATAQSGGGENLLLYPPQIHHHYPPLYSTPFNASLPGMQFSLHPRSCCD